LHSSPANEYLSLTIVISCSERCWDKATSQLLTVVWFRLVLKLPGNCNSNHHGIPSFEFHCPLIAEITYFCVALHLTFHGWPHLVLLVKWCTVRYLMRFTCIFCQLGWLHLLPAAHMKLKVRRWLLWIRKRSIYSWINSRNRYAVQILF